jgi:enamine deaminase RidA (YjgF/YER057c/UK114 family)
MSVERKHVGARMSQLVIQGNTVYLAGQVAQNAPDAPVAEQTRDILATIDKLLAEAGTDKSNLLSATIWLADIGTFNDMRPPSATPRPTAASVSPTGMRSSWATG